MTTTSIVKLSELTSTAVAAYGELNIGNLEFSLVDKAGFTTVKAKAFIEKYSLIHQLPNVPLNGFSAAVFKDLNTGRHVVAMRGTEAPVFPSQTWLDLVIADGKIATNGFAANQAVEMFRYYKSLTTNGGQSVTYTLTEQWQMFAMKNSLLVPLAGTIPVLSAALAADFLVFQNTLSLDTATAANQVTNNREERRAA